MSFILESIKQAERNRKLGKVPSISVEYAVPYNEVLDSNWLKWALVSIGFVVVALAIWVGSRMLVINEFSFTTEYTGSEIIDIKPQQLNAKTSKTVEENLVVTKQETVDSGEVQTIGKEANTSRNVFVYTPNESLRNSQLKSVRVINQQELESQVKIVDKRSEVSKQDVIQIKQPVQANSVESNDVQDISASRNAESKSLQGQDNVASPRDKLISLYSDLAVITEEELLVENTPSATPHTTNRPSSHEEPLRLASIDTVQKNDVSSHISKAVNTGVSDFGELPYAVQEEIPDLSISVHLFNEDPAQRRIRINGQMYTESAKLHKDLALVEITRYGAIFDYQGHVFRLNVR